MIVPDNSILVRVLTGANPSISLLRRLAGETLHAPHIIDVEFLNALRGLVHAKKLSPDRARDARRDFFSLPIVRYPIVDEGKRIWELRHNLTSYDACYIVLAEALGCSLLTCDAKLDGVAGHRAQVELTLD